ARVNDTVGAVKIKGRVVADQGQIGFMIRLNGSKVLPVAVKQTGLHVVRPDAAGEDLLAEVRGQRRRVQQFDKDIAIEQIDAHTGQVLPLLAVDSPSADPIFRRAQGVKLFAGLRLLDETDYAARVTQVHDSEVGRLARRHRKDGD